jgi:putative membrane protein (TIGR04086 family)
MSSLEGIRMLGRIRWLRIVGAAVAVEIVLFGIAIPLNMSAKGRAALVAIVIPMCVLGPFIGGWWAARKAGARLLIHGLLVGAITALIYAAITWKVRLPTIYIVANSLKLVGGAAGGLTAQWVSRPRPSGSLRLRA